MTPSMTKTPINANATSFKSLPHMEDEKPNALILQRSIIRRSLLLVLPCGEPSDQDRQYEGTSREHWIAPHPNRFIATSPILSRGRAHVPRRHTTGALEPL
jgi:hypothetical protein